MQVQLNGIHKQYGNNAILRGIDLEINSGEGVVLLGANGCGKSTLLRCLLGLESVDSGEVLINDTRINHAHSAELRRLRRHIGTVFQQFNLVRQLSVLQNVLFGRLGSDGLLRSLNMTADHTTRMRAMACLDRVGLAHLAPQRTDTLSGGQQQRVAIARMLMQDAQLVLADEPVASLDPRSGREVMELLFEIVRERKLTLICVLHQLDLAQEFAQRIIGLRQGRILLDGSPAALSAESLQSLYALPS